MSDICPARDYFVRIDHKLQLVGIGRDYYHNIDPDEFASWCRKHGVELRPVQPLLYEPEFRDEAAREAFDQRWVEGALRWPFSA